MHAASQVPSFDLYKELEVDPSASSETIEAAYRSLIKRHHPDATGAITDERAKRLNTARDWLVDPALRRRYDYFRSRAPVPAASVPPPAERDYARPSRSSPPARPTPARAPHLVLFGGYVIGCIIAVVVAQIGAMLFGVFALFTTLAQIVAALVGPDVSDSAITFMGNVVFAVIFGYLVAELVGWLGGQSSTERGRYVAGVSSGALAFVFPAISVGALVWLADMAPGIARPIAEDATLGLGVVVVAYGLVGGLAALGLSRIADMTD